MTVDGETRIYIVYIDWSAPSIDINTDSLDTDMHAIGHLHSHVTNATITPPSHHHHRHHHHHPAAVGLYIHTMYNYFVTNEGVRNKKKNPLYFNAGKNNSFIILPINVWQP